MSTSELSWKKVRFGVAVILQGGVIAQKANECGYNWVLC